MARRAAAKTLPSDPAVRETIANWYDPATLSLLEGSPVNCLLVDLERGHRRRFGAPAAGTR